MKKIISHLLFFLLCVFTFTSCTKQKTPLTEQEQQAIDLFYEFDADYIPVLYLTSHNKQKESEKQFQKIRESHFKDQEMLIVPFTRAERFIKDNQLQDAHEELEKIRQIYKNIRKQNGINNYFLDYLNEFHEEMEDFILKDKDTLNNLLVKLEEIENNFENAYLPEHVSKEKIKEFIINEKEAVSKLKNSKNLNAEQIQKFKKQIKINFVKAYTSFGKFEKEISIK